MDLSRQEYPAFMASLQPGQAVDVLNDRVKLIARTNTEIADWLLERRRVEEQYVQGLKKLAARRQQDGATALGVFQTPWQSIISSAQSLADSHSNFAQKLEVDVERPLREYQNKNRETQALSTTQGNLASMARELEEAQKKSEKLKSKGGKADAGKVLSADRTVQNAQEQWENQAPYIFEQLQALDEDRVNNLRNKLTQLQTHELDQLERSRTSAESCLNTLLTVNTSDEISTFVATIAGDAPTLRPRQQNRARQPSTSTTRKVSLTPVPVTPAHSDLTLVTPTPSRSAHDRREEKAAPSFKPPATPKEQKKGGMSGLKRLGTVIGRRKPDSNSADRASSPEKKPRSSRNPLRRGPSSKNMQQIPSPTMSATDVLAFPEHSQTPAGRGSSLDRPSQESTPQAERRRSQADANGDVIEMLPPRDSSLTNGNRTHHETSQSQEQRPPSTIQEEGERDADGFNVALSVTDDIARAQQEAAAESDAPQFKLDIRKESIREEDGDAQTALSNVANTLRAQAMPQQRKPGTIRGRRDVRNTIFIPNPSTPEAQTTADSFLRAALPLYSLPALSPVVDDHRGADAQSVKSARSLSNISQPTIKHPEMQQPGLNASIVETVSAWFVGGQVTRAVVIGELALAYNMSKEAAPLGSEVIRLDNFPVLEKVAPNPTFINQVASKSGEYTLDLKQVSRTSVAFKYQVHLDESNLATHVPVILYPNWKFEPSRASVILNYDFNPAFQFGVQKSISLHNVMVVINIEKAKALTCASKPMGHFSKEKNMIYWRLGDLILNNSTPSPHKLLARFTTEGEASAGNVEARWEINGENSKALGSGLGLSQMRGAREEGADPFADESMTGDAGGLYKEVPVLRKLISGKYMAN